MDEKGVSWLKGSSIAESRLDVQTAFCYTKLMNFSFMLNLEVSLAFNWENNNRKKRLFFISTDY